MKEDLEGQDLQLRRYLLGELSSEEEQNTEERLLTDDAYLEQMMIVEEEIIDDYANGLLPPSQQQSYEELFLSTNEGRQKLKDSQILRNNLKNLRQEKPVEPAFLERFRVTLANFFSPPVLTAAAALLVVALGGIGWWMFFQSNLRVGVTALRDAYQQERPLEARITGFPYADFPGASSSSNQVNLARLRTADNAFQKLSGNNNTPASLHALGKYNLTKKNFDEAIRNLEEGSKAAPENTALHIDLAVAYLERGKVESSKSMEEKASSDFNLSRFHLQEALRLDSYSPEARFNLALLHQTLKSWKDAEQNWRLYLNLDSSSQWAKEAGNYLDAAIKAQK